MKFLKILGIIVLCFVAASAGAAWKIFDLMNQTYSDPIVIPNGSYNGNNGSVVRPEPLPGIALRTDPVLGTTNVLLIGVDQFNLADAIAIAFFNPREETIGVLSIPRDSRVQIPGRRWDKVNHAFSFGGANLLRETLVNLTGVTINYTVVISFNNFIRAIDLVGGIDMYVERALRYTDRSQSLFINIPRGQQRLDGRRSLDFVRFRSDPMGDLGRIQRQQRFMTALVAQIATPSMVPRIPSLVGEILSAVNTDLSPIQAGRLATYATRLRPGGLQFGMAPGRATFIGGISYWSIDTVELSVMIPRLITAEEIPEQSEEPTIAGFDEETALDLITQVQRIGILNGDGTRGLARRASQIFQGIGIDVPFTGDARHFGFERSNIIYPSEQYRQAAEALARLSGITNALVRRDSSARMVSIILGRDKETIFSRLQNVALRP